MLALARGPTGVIDEDLQSTTGSTLQWAEVQAETDPGSKVWRDTALPGMTRRFTSFDKARVRLEPQGGLLDFTYSERAAEIETPNMTGSSELEAV